MAWNSSKETSAPSGASSQDPILLFESDDEAHISGADGAVVVERPSSSESPEIDAPALKKVRREDDSEPPASSSSSSSGAARPGGPPFSGEQQDSERHAPCPIKLFATDSDLQARQVHYETTGTTNHWSYTQCWTLRELLGLDQNQHDTRSVNNNNDIEWLVISNFIINFEFLLQELPELLSIPQVLVIYGHADDPATMEQWKQNHIGRVDFVQRDPSVPPTTTGTINPLSVSMPYGCHHTKLFLVGLAPSPMHHSSRTLRVMVHTSNLRSNDVHAKCQGAFVQDFPWKQELFETSEFEETLIAYLLTYRFTEKRLWQQQQQQPNTKPKDTAAGTTSDDDADDDSQPCVLVDQISKYDFSKAMGVLIPSIPGFHKVPSSSAVGSSSRALGYLAVRKAIQQHVHAVKKSRSPQKQKQLSASGGSGGSTIVCQFSSIGSLSEKYLQSLWTAWDVHSVLHPPRTMEVTKTGSLLPATKVAGPSRFQLVYPTYREIVESVEGLSGGGSVPGQSKNVQKPFLQPLYRKWTCRRPGAKTIVPPTIINTTMGKGENVPHIKTYYQTVAGDDASMHWFVLGSQNLSKAAWGELQNGMRGPTFKVLHWELGVFVSAETLGVDLLVPFDETRDEDSSTIGRRLCEIPLPYPFRPDRYEAGDTAWMVDRIPH